MLKESKARLENGRPTGRLWQHSKGRHDEDLDEDLGDREKWTGLSCILKVEFTVLAGGWDAEDKGRKVMENHWIFGLVNFVDRLSFAELVSLNQEEEASFENGVEEEKMMSSALVMLSLGWYIQVERPSKPLVTRIWHMRRAIGAGSSDRGVISM